MIQLLIGLFLLSTSIGAQPLNDDPCNAYKLIPNEGGCLPFEDNSLNSVTSIFNATGTPGISNFVCHGDDPVPDMRDIWFKIATGNSNTIIRVDPIPGFDVFFGIYYRSSGGCATNDLSLEFFGCFNESGPGLPDSVFIPSFYNFIDTIYIRVFHYFGGPGVPPVNNSQFSICAYTPAPSCVANSFPDDNAELLGLSTMQWGFDQAATAYDIYMGSSVASATLIGTSTFPGFSYTGPALSPGTYYWYIVPKNGTVVATGCASNASSFAIMERSANDLRCNAVVLLPTTITGNPYSDPAAVSTTSNFTATFSNDIPSGNFNCAGASPVQADLWFKFTAPDSSIYTIRVNPVASVNTSFRVYEAAGGCLGTLTNKGCFNTGAVSIQDSGNIFTHTGKEYFIQVFNQFGDAGVDPPGNSQFSIAVVKQAPSCLSPLLISPINGASSIDHINESLSWNNVANVTAYDLYLGTTAGNMVKTNYTILQDGFTTQTLKFFDNFLLSSPLSPGTQYFWKIVPGNNDLINTNCATEIRSFTTATCPFLGNAIQSSQIQLNHAGEMTYKIPCPNCPPSWLVLEYGPNANQGSGTNPAAGNFIVYPAQPVSLPAMPENYAAVDSPHQANGYNYFIRTVGCATGSTQFLPFDPGTPAILPLCSIKEIRAGGGTGRWNFIGQYPINSNGNATPGYMSWFNFTPAETGVYYLQVDSVTSNNFIDYLYKPDSLNRYSPSNWTGITEINAKGKYAIGYLNAGVLYHFVADGTNLAKQFIKICKADVAAPAISNSCIEANIRKAIPALSPKEEFAIDTAGRLIASFKAGVQTPGLVNVSYYVNGNGLRYDANGREYLGRNFTLTPSLPVSSAQEIKLFFRNQELSDLINAPDDGNADVVSINDLVVTKTNQDCSMSASVSINDNILLQPTERGNYDATAGFIKLPVSSFSTFYLHGGNNFILPLTLLEFTGHRNGPIVSLSWKTENEQNSSHFELQRSIDGIGFSSLGTITAFNSSGAHAYSFDDLHPLKAVSFYRLKQVDRDGRISFSRVIRITMNDGSDALRVWPNPVKEELFIEYTGTRGMVQIRIFDSKGALMRSASTRSSANMLINVQSLATGMYWIELNDGAITNRSVFVKQ